MLCLVPFPCNTSSSIDYWLLFLFCCCLFFLLLGLCARATSLLRSRQSCLCNISCAQSMIKPSILNRESNLLATRETELKLLLFSLSLSVIFGAPRSLRVYIKFFADFSFSSVCLSVWFSCERVCVCVLVHSRLTLFIHLLVSRSIFHHCYFSSGA